MNIKTFQAVDMKSAIARIKEEMGPEAIILGTKQVRASDGTYGLGTRAFIEVTAALDDNAPPPPPKKTEKAAAKTVKKSTLAKDSEVDQLKGEIASIRSMIAEGLLADASLKKAAGMAEELENMRSMLAFMMENSDFYKGAGLEPNYLACYRRMVDRGVDREYALKLVREVREGVPGNREFDLKSIVTRIGERINEAMVTAGPVAPLTSGAPRIISLVGPTGVGKTTTAAKIAARLTMDGKKVGLITIDTYRIAAVEQLKTYAQIMDVPLEVAMTPDELSDAVENFAGKDVIVIDTAGRSQQDFEKLTELAGFLKSGPEMENLLVLSSAADSASVEEAIKNFGRIEISGIIFTKMDETLKPGVVISQNFKTGIPLYYVTSGQRVPEDIESASPSKLTAALFKKHAGAVEQTPKTTHSSAGAAHV